MLTQNFFFFGGGGGGGGEGDKVYKVYYANVKVANKHC